jgi:hypothetical protein
VRVTGWIEGDEGATVVQVEAPLLGEAAPELYEQRALWETRPSEDDTAINIFARAAQEVRSENLESSLYDLGLLRHFSKSKRLFERKLRSMEVPESSRRGSPMATLDKDLSFRALELSQQTPAPRQVRVVGHLDMIRHSTRSFEILLEEGKAVRGVLEDTAEMEKLSSLLGQKILIAGKAVYRASGSLLRIDAHGVEAGGTASRLFSHVPPPIERHAVAVRFRPGEQSRRGVTGFFGKWPGSESDEELQSLLRELRG